MLCYPPANSCLSLGSDMSGLMENKAGLVIGEQCDMGKVMIGKDKSITVTLR